MFVRWSFAGLSFLLASICLLVSFFASNTWKGTAYISRFELGWRGLGGVDSQLFTTVGVGGLCSQQNCQMFFFSFFTSIIKFPRRALRVTRPQKHCVQTFRNSRASERIAVAGELMDVGCVFQSVYYTLNTPRVLKVVSRWRKIVITRLRRCSGVNITATQPKAGLIKLWFLWLIFNFG